jgi:hypothetical protein
METRTVNDVREMAHKADRIAVRVRTGENETITLILTKAALFEALAYESPAKQMPAELDADWLFIGCA